MSGWLMGIPARLLALHSDVTTYLVPNRRTTPWRITGLPAVGTGYTSFGASINVGGVATTALGSSTALTTVVDITGSGILDFCMVQRGNSTTAATIKVVVTVDGTVVSDTTSSSSTGAYAIRAILGELFSSAVPACGGGAATPIYFRSSLKVEVQQSANASSSALMRYFLAEPVVL